MRQVENSDWPGTDLLKVNLGKFLCCSRCVKDFAPQLDLLAHGQCDQINNLLHFGQRFKPYGNN